MAGDPDDAFKLACASPFLRPSFSQFGEDRILQWAFAEKRDGFYVDIGCHHHLNISTTALLHLKNGWSGVNVDLDARTIEAFNVHRPLDRNVHTAVGGSAGRAEAIIYNWGEQNTLGAIKPELAEHYHATETVDLVTLPTLLETYVPAGRTIDYMNIDAEGSDYAILCSNDWTRFRPKFLTVEVEMLDLEQIIAGPTHQLLSAQGYKLFSHAIVTSFYMDRGAFA